MSACWELQFGVFFYVHGSRHTSVPSLPCITFPLPLASYNNRPHPSSILISWRSTGERGFPSASPFTWWKPYRLPPLTDISNLLHSATWTCSMLVGLAEGGLLSHVFFNRYRTDKAKIFAPRPVSSLRAWHGHYCHVLLVDATHRLTGGMF
jgi:hypothetical protein